MKTMKQVTEEGYVPAKLARSVIRQLGGKDNLEDIYRYGASGGFNGFIYYSDTVKFYRRHRKEIIQLAEQLADDLEIDATDLIIHFGCFEGSKHDSRFKREIMQTLYGRVVDTNVANAMSWFALEEVARAFCDQ